jgi:tripartite-type tricarboxylate transporter receptor subunit TctC
MKVLLAAFCRFFVRHQRPIFHEAEGARTWRTPCRNVRRCVLRYLCPRIGPRDRTHDKKTITNTKGGKMKKLTRRTFVTGSAVLLCAPAVRTEAQSAWPSKSIRIIVPYPPGGQTDGIARAFGDFLARQVGKTVIVENKGGAGGPVVAAKKTGATTLREFIEYAKKVGSLNWGSYGVGSTPHVLIETIAKQYGIKFQVIQYRGEAPMWNDIAGQTLDGAAGSYAAAAPVIQAGTGNLIGVVGSRLPPYPDAPTMTEQGAVGDFYDLRAFTTFAVPAGTPQEIVQRLSPILIQAGSDPKVQQMLNNFLLSSPADLETTARIFKRDSDVMLRILRDLGVKPSE